MTEPSQEAVIKIIQRCVARKKGAVKKPFSAQTELLQGGLLESFDLVEIAQEIAREFERPIPRGALVLDDFETPEALWNRLSEVWQPQG